MQLGSTLWSTFMCAGYAVQVTDMDFEVFARDDVDGIAGVQPPADVIGITIDNRCNMQAENSSPCKEKETTAAASSALRFASGFACEPEADWMTQEKKV